MIAAHSLTATLLAFALALPASAQQRLEVPKNDGWVTDLASMLTPDEEHSLEALMESYRSGTGHEIALLTVPELKGEPIEGFALRVGREWKMGREGKDDAALLVVSKADRAVRIEVGRGLEGNVPDSIAGRIIRDVIVPRFKAGKFYAGLREGIEAIHAAIGGDYGPLKQRGGSSSKLAPLAGLLPMLFILFVIFAITRGRRRGRGAFPFGAPFLLPGGIGRTRGGGGFGGFSGGGGGGFGGFGGGGGFSGGGASGKW